MMRVLGDKVLVALPPLEHEREESTGYDYRTTKTSDSGLILAQRADSYSEEAQTRGIVMQLGEKPDSVSLGAVYEAIDDVPRNEPTAPNGDFGLIVVGYAAVFAAVKKLSPAPFDVQVGDCVLFAPSSGNPFTHNGVNYLILSEDDILAVLEPQKADAA